MRRRLIVVAAAAMLVIAGALPGKTCIRWRSRCGRASAPGSVAWRFHTPRRQRCGGQLQRYVEADYVMVTSSIGGTLMTLDVARGDQVSAARRCSRSTPPRARRRDEAAAKLAQAQSPACETSASASASRRSTPSSPSAPKPSGAAPVAGRFRAPDAAARDARLQPEQLDDARSQRDRDQSHLAELDAQLEVARMPARDDEIAPAKPPSTAAQAALAQAEWRLGQKTAVAPQPAWSVDTLYRPARWWRRVSPIVQLLPPAT